MPHDSPPPPQHHPKGSLPGAETGLAAPRHQGTDRVVFGVTAVLTLSFVLWGALGTDSLESVSGTLLGELIHTCGWAFVLAASCFVIFALWLAISRYGRIHLGSEHEKPEFRTVSWIAMMFSAGMGIGLMFWGVSEPLAHFVDAPPGTRPASDGERMSTAMATTLFHWTLHPWAIYAVVGLGIAYSTFRKKRRQTISSVFTPLIGRRHAEGAVGRVIDILAIVATVFGSAASLGLGTLQIGSGMHEVGWLDEAGTGLLVAIIAVLTLAFVASAVSGVERGIQWLSNTNMVLALLLALFVFVAGPTIVILDLLPSSLFAYLGDLSQLAGRTEISGGPTVDEWLSNWTVFYWAWWISWTPFVGMFIARISRGRTIRQFIGGVILVPSTVSLLWFAVFGGSAMQLQAGNMLDEASTVEGRLFAVLREYPISTVTSLLVMILVAIFFVSGADAASIVMGTLSQRGALEPQKTVVVFWGVVTGAVAAIMLMVGSGEGDALTGLQNLTILAAAPFVLVMIGICFALMRDLRRDPLMLREEAANEALEDAVVTGYRKFDGDFELQVRPSQDSGPGSGSTVADDSPL
ncbi:BCCT family transporter [Streptomyces chilikensis]|uniref:BCCT family transporter n=1 Tax=Streptomyces chilikensis TaxID=1194079 RepID=UPI000A68DB68|nr:choline/carnitine/betaine transport [Streptomyces sp. MJP52]